MKKKTKTTKKSKTAPFTCVVKGDGIDLNIKLGSTPNFAKFFETLRERMTAESDDCIVDIGPEDLKAGSAMFVKPLPTDELIILGDEIEAEIMRRTGTNGTPKASDEDSPTSTASA